MVGIERSKKIRQHPTFMRDRSAANWCLNRRPIPITPAAAKGASRGTVHQAMAHSRGEPSGKKPRACPSPGDMCRFFCRGGMKKSNSVATLLAESLNHIISTGADCRSTLSRTKEITAEVTARGEKSRPSQSRCKSGEDRQGPGSG